jgi:polyisoprenoid-binding protein YceI
VKHTKPILLAVSALLLASLTALAPRAAVFEARSGTYTVDGTHSTAFFGIRHVNVANFYARFNEISGQLVLDVDDIENSSITLSINPKSVDTNSDGRDDHIRGAEFLDVEKFPLMAFESTAVRAVEDGLLSVDGKLDLHGVSSDITIQVRLVGAGETFFGDYRVGTETTFTVKRTDHGMNSMLDKLGDEVKFTVSLEGVRQDD